MSRIDEALRRARKGPDGGPVEVPQHGDDVFVSPWEFDASAEGPAKDAGPARAVPAPVVPAPVVPAPVAPDTAVAEAPKAPVPANVPAIEKLVAGSRTPGRAFEQYRKLGATLHQAQIEKSIHVVMLTSAVAGEGKTLTAANLALTLSQSYGRNTLLIDADLRRPMLHTLFEVPNVTGLSDGLRDGAGPRLSVQRLSPRLSLLTAGRPDGDPTSLLTSDLMRRVIEEAAVSFDWVVIDTPPVGLLTDAKLLAGMVDTVLFVIQAASTPYDVARSAIDAVGKERVLGVVLNRVETARPLGRDKYYHYDHYYSDVGGTQAR